MDLPVNVAILGFSATLLGAVVGIAWKASALLTRLEISAKRSDERERELATKVEALNAIPRILERLGFVEVNYAQVPKHESRLVALEVSARFSTERRLELSREIRERSSPRLPSRGSRPDPREVQNENDDGDGGDDER